MKTADIIERVRILLDYNHTVLPIDIPTEDTLELDEVIRRQIEPAARLVVMEAPTEHIPWENAAESLQKEWDATRGRLTVHLPKDMLRLWGAKMRTWLRPVMRATDIDSAAYQSTLSEYASLRPSNRKPMLALAQDAAGPVAELWGATREDIDYLLLLRRPRIHDEPVQAGTPATQTDGPVLKAAALTPEPATESVINVPEVLADPFLYAAAALTAEALKDTQKAQTLLALSRGMTGVGIERKNIYQPRPANAGPATTSAIEPAH